MKLKNLNKNQYSSDIEKKLQWCRNNLVHIRQDFQVLDNGCVKAKIVDVHTYIKEFPFTFVGAQHIKIQKTDELESFNNFPKGASNTDIIFLRTNPSLKIDFNDLPLFTEVNHLSFCFKKINSITTKHLSKYDNIHAVNFEVCQSDVLYDISKYDMSCYIFKISPTQRLINLNEILINQNFNCEIFMIESYNDSYSNDEILLLNRIIQKYLAYDAITRQEFVMDFTVDLIDAGFENEV